MTFNMVLKRAEGLGGDVAHEQCADDIGGKPRTNRPPPPGEVVYNADMDQRAVRFQKPGDIHPPTDPAHMGKMDLMLSGFYALSSRPADGKPVTMRGHLHQTVWEVSREDPDPAIMR